MLTVRCLAWSSVTLQCIVQTIDGVMAPRVITTLVVIALLVGVASLVL